MIFKKLNQHKENIAFIDESNKKYFYKDLISFCDLFCSKIEKRSLILILCENHYEAISFYISAIYNKHVPILIDNKTSAEYTKNIIKLYKPNYIFLRNEINEFSKNYFLNTKLERFKLIEKNKKISIQLYKNLAVLLPTSGTTGSPKMARISYQNIYSNTKSIIKYLNIKNKHRTITTLPFSYSYGFSVINTHIEAGSSIVLNEYSIIQKKFWELFNKNKVTNFSGVPYTFEIIKKLKINVCKNKTFIYSTLAGGKLDDECIRYFYKEYNKYKKKFIIMYGQTECSPRISYLPWNKINKNFDSIGVAIPMGKLSIKNEQKYKNLSLNKVGELHYKGPNVFLGYASKAKDLVKKDEYKGSINTLDLAYKKNGLFFLYARSKRIIKCYGKRINLDDIEYQLKKINIEAVCKGSENNIVIFFINNSTKNKIKDLLFNKMFIPKSITKIKKLDKIPILLSGKVDYKELDIT